MSDALKAGLILLIMAIIMMTVYYTSPCRSPNNTDPVCKNISLEDENKEK